LTIKVAHSVVITPGRSGLYETTRELVAALRLLNVDSRLVNADLEGKYGAFNKAADRGVPVADWDWAVDADVLVSHSGYDGTPGAETNQPVILCCHGRPYNSLMIESESGGKKPIYSFMGKKNYDERIKAVVTFWPEHIKIFEVLFPDKPVKLVQSTIDLDEWTDGPAKYDFCGKGGDINVVCTETWRQDGGPWMPLNVFALWARDNPGAKIHLYAVPKNLGGYKALIQRIKADGNLGEVRGWVQKGMKEIYRSADLALTGNIIDTRTVREAMACGCPVMKINEFPQQTVFSTCRKSARMIAESRFNPAMSALQFKTILDNV